jgi:hypothetical protein
MTLPNLTRRRFSALLLACLPAAKAFSQQTPDPLPSWREGESKRAILDFIHATTTVGTADYVTPADRLALFDNDGTLWPEQPIYTEVAFAMERLRILAADHPEWADHQLFRAAMAGDAPAVAQSGLRGMGEIVMAVESNTTPEALRETVVAWLKTARHPRFGRPYSECVYQPMREVLALFRSAGFRHLRGFRRDGGVLALVDGNRLRRARGPGNRQYIQAALRTAQRPRRIDSTRSTRSVERRSREARGGFGKVGSPADRRLRQLRRRLRDAAVYDDKPGPTAWRNCLP